MQLHAHQPIEAGCRALALPNWKGAQKPFPQRIGAETSSLGDPNVGTLDIEVELMTDGNNSGRVRRVRAWGRIGVGRRT